jgi:4-hydroxy-4-methyl-2-oxoglutarate aldolase
MEKSNLTLLLHYPTSLIADALGVSRAINSTIKPVSANPNFIGRAVPIKEFPGSNVTVHEAVSNAKEGAVLVINASACTERAVWGGLLQRCAEVRGLAAVIVDGAVRDTDELIVSSVPVYAVAKCPIKPLKGELGDINQPTLCGGILVSPGDIVRGDSDGVIVFSPARLEEVDEACKKIIEREMAMRAFIEANRCTPRSSVGSNQK